AKELGDFFKSDIYGKQNISMFNKRRFQRSSSTFHITERFSSNIYIIKNVGILYDMAIRLNPDHALAYYNRALVWRQKADQRAAIADFQKYLDLGEGIRSGDQATVEGFIRDLKQQQR